MQFGFGWGRGCLDRIWLAWAESSDGFHTCFHEPKFEKKKKTDLFFLVSFFYT